MLTAIDATEVSAWVVTGVAVAGLLITVWQVVRSQNAQRNAWFRSQLVSDGGDLAAALVDMQAAVRDVTSQANLLLDLGLAPVEELDEERAQLAKDRLEESWAHVRDANVSVVKAASRVRLAADDELNDVLRALEAAAAGTEVLINEAMVSVMKRDADAARDRLERAMRQAPSVNETFIDALRGARKTLE